MQYKTEKKPIKIYDIHHVVEELTSFKMVNRACYDKGFKRSDCKQRNWNGVCVQDDNLHHVSDLIKPCHVALRRINLLGHNENTFSNCCVTLPEMMFSEESVINKKIEKLELGNSVAGNGIENLSKKNRDMNLFFESLCESFQSIECKKKKNKETEKVECDVLSSSSSEEGINNTSVLSSSSSEEGIDNTSMELIGNVHQERNQITKASETSKPCIINSSFNCQTSYLPKFKSNDKKIVVKQNFKSVNENSRQSYEGNDSEIENEVPSNRDIKNVQTRKSSSERYTNLKIKICEIPKKDYGLFVDRRNNYYVPLVGSAVKILSKFPIKPKQDKTVQGDVLLSSLNNFNPNCALNPETDGKEKAENASNKNCEGLIETLEEHADQKNLKGTTENYPVDKDVELIKKNSACLSNHKIKSFENTDSTLVENSDVETQILQEHIVQRNLKGATKKYPADMNTELVNENLHISESVEFLEDNRSPGNEQMLHKLMKPCSVFINLMNQQQKNSFSNTDITVARDEAKSNIFQMEIESQFETGSSPSSKNRYLSLGRIHKISSRNSVTEFTSNEQTIKVPSKIPVIKPCCVLLHKLPISECLKFMNPKVIKSVCNENVSCPNVRVETESCTSEEKNAAQSRMSFCSPTSYHSISSTKSDSIPNIDAVSKFTVINQQTMSVPKKPPLIKPCFVSLQKISDEFMKFVVPLRKSSIISQNNAAQSRISFCSPSSDHSISSIKSDSIPNIDTVSKFTVINQQTKSVPRKTPLIKPCFVSLKKISDDEIMKFVVPLRKSSIISQNNVMKFKRKNNFMALKRRKLWFFHKKNKFKNRFILNKMQIKKLIKAFARKKWKRKPPKSKETLEKCGKYLRVKGHSIKDNCKNVKTVSSMLLSENQYICNTTADLLPKCSLNSFRTNKCFVHLERMDIDKYLNENKNLHINQCDLKCSTSSDILPKCPNYLMGNFRTDECFVLLERINVDEYLVKNTNNQHENIPLSKHSIKNKYNRYQIYEDFKPNSSLSKLKRRSSLRIEQSAVKKIKTKANYCTSKKTVKTETVGNYSNVICDSDYKCVQCRKSITTDAELYHHLCRGKRKEGFICDICERIFKTVNGLKMHLNYHFKFINFP